MSEDFTVRTKLPVTKWREYRGDPALEHSEIYDDLVFKEAEAVTLEVYGRSVGQEMLEDCARLLSLPNELYGDMLKATKPRSRIIRWSWQVRYALGSALRWLASRIDGLREAD